MAGKTGETVENAPKGGDYRQHLPDISIPRFATMQKQDAHEYAKDFVEGGKPPWLHALYLHWRELFKEPFKGVTSDGMSWRIIPCPPGGTSRLTQCRAP